MHFSEIRYKKVIYRVFYLTGVLTVTGGAYAHAHYAPCMPTALDCT